MPTVAKWLEMVHSTSAAIYLAEMAPTFAAACLAVMPCGAGADRLSWLDPEKAQQLLRLEEPAQSVAHLRQMQPSAATAVIAEMPAVTASEWLNRLSGDVASRITADLPSEAKIALILTEDLPERLTLELLFGLDFNRTVRLLRIAPTQAANLLASMPEDPAAGVFAALPRHRRGPDGRRPGQLRTVRRSPRTVATGPTL